VTREILVALDESPGAPSIFAADAEVAARFLAAARLVCAVAASPDLRPEQRALRRRSRAGAR
jgi:hypothetical protein